MYAALGLLLFTGFYPFRRAWQANRRTTLRHAVGWAGCAWAAWCLAACASAAWPAADVRLLRHLALCLTGCAGAAVLGARRPIVAAWNFVVASLLVVLLWPVAEGLGDLRMNGFLMTLLAAALAVGMLNYLPTRLAAAVLPAGVACAIETCIVLQWIDPAWWDPCALALLAVAPWLGLGAARRRSEKGVWNCDFRVPDTFFGPEGIDREWLAFRDRFGLVWAWPARDQFNRAAANAGWGVVLDWKGLRTPAAPPHPNPPPPRVQGREGAVLRAVLRRFGPDEESPP